MPNLKIDDIVNVVVSTAAASAPRAGFNIGMIVGKTVGTGMSATKRTIVVASLDEVVDAGYATTTPEYKAAAMYFAQNPAPNKLVLALCVGTTENGTTTYETWVEAITAARAENQDWYAVYIADATGLSAADHAAVAAYLETMRAAYFFEDGTAAAKTSATTDVFYALKGASYERTFGLFSTTKYAGAAVMGVAMGANTGVANSAYTMAYKTLVGVTPDDLSPTEVGYLQGKNANYYVIRGGSYNVLEKGVCASGKWFDEVIGIDQLAYNIQMACMDVLANTKTKIPYTDAGASIFVLSCNDACRQARNQGFLAPGVWKGAECLALKTGDTLEAGYYCQAEPVADQSASDKANRICPPIYVCAILAGAIHQATIKVDLV